MSGEGRERILAAVRRAVGRQGASPADDRPLQAGLDDPRAQRFRFRDPPPGTDRTALFAERARARGFTVALGASTTELAGLVADHIARERLPPVVRVAPHPALLAADWRARPEIAVAGGAPLDGDPIGLCWAERGILETGSLVISSGPTAPHALGFMPPVVVVVLESARIVDSMEDLFEARRREGGWPRVTTLVSGCATTADIEAHFVRGPHGPSAVHVIVLASGG